MGVIHSTVIYWRQRWEQGGMDGLNSVSFCQINTSLPEELAMVYAHTGADHKEITPEHDATISR